MHQSTTPPPQPSTKQNPTRTPYAKRYPLGPLQPSTKQNPTRTSLWFIKKPAIPPTLNQYKP